MVQACITSSWFAAWAGPEPFVRNAEHVELGWFTPDEARGLNLADPVYLERLASSCSIVILNRKILEASLRATRRQFSTLLI